MRFLASEHTGTECFITGWRFRISEVQNGAEESRSNVCAAIVTPTCHKESMHDIQALPPQNSKSCNINVERQEHHHSTIKQTMQNRHT